MSDVVWRLNGTTAEDLGVENLVLKRVSAGVDVLTFTAPGMAADATPLFEYREQVELKRDGVRYFEGLCVTMPVYGGPSDERQTYEIHGPWYWLNCLYQHQRNAYVSGSLQTTTTTRVILGRQFGGTKLTSGEQMAAAASYAITRGALFQVGDFDPDLDIPWEECIDITCAEVLEKLLRLSPDCMTWFDYETDPPTLHCTKIANAPRIEIPIEPLDDDDERDTYRTKEFRCTPRHDLKIEGVQITFEQTHTVDGGDTGETVYRSVVTQSAGATGPFSTLQQTIQLAGSAIVFQTQRVKTEAFGTLATNKAFWKSHLPWLPGENEEDPLWADWSVQEASKSSELNYYLTEGMIADWMPVNSEECIVEATIKLTVRSLDDEGLVVVDWDDKPVTVRVIATDATMRVYRRLESVESGEPIPVGLAAALFASWGRLQYDGHVVLEDVDVPGGYRPGQKLCLTRGLAAWATMDATVQEVSEDIDSGRTTISFGPCRRLGPDDLITMLNQGRNRRIAMSHNEVESGKLTDNAGTVDTSGKHALSDGSAGEGEPNKVVVTARDPDGSANGRVELDPRNMTAHQVMTVQDVDDLLTIKPGWVRFHA